MTALQIFDPAMCCSTGVCGVDVDPVLVQFAADLKWVAEQGVDCLPIVVDGQIVATGSYLTRAQLAQKLKLAPPAEGKPSFRVGSAGCKPNTRGG